MSHLKCKMHCAHSSMNTIGLVCVSLTGNTKCKPPTHTCMHAHLWIQREGETDLCRHATDAPNDGGSGINQTVQIQKQKAGLCCVSHIWGAHPSLPAVAKDSAKDSVRLCFHSPPLPTLSRFSSYVSFVYYLCSECLFCTSVRTPRTPTHENNGWTLFPMIMWSPGQFKLG